MKRTQHSSTHRGEGGFTLVELLVATGISGVVVALCLVCFMAVQRLHAAALTRSALRTEIIRLFDILEIDLRNATAVSAATNGSRSILPLTITVPQRYTAFESTGAWAGEPGREASRIQPTVSAGRLSFIDHITIRYDALNEGPNRLSIRRTVTWMAAGSQRSATKVVALMPLDTDLRFRSGKSSSASPFPIAADDVALSARVSAPAPSNIFTPAAATVMESTIFMRRRALR